MNPGVDGYNENAENTGYGLLRIKFNNNGNLLEYFNKFIFTIIRKILLIAIMISDTEMRKHKTQLIRPRVMNKLTTTCVKIKLVCIRQN